MASSLITCISILQSLLLLTIILLLLTDNTTSATFQLYSPVIVNRNNKELLLLSSKSKLFLQYNIENMAGGKAKGCYIVEQWVVPGEGLNLDSQLVEEQKKRGIIEIPNQVTLPIALMTLDPEQFPTKSSAKKALR